MTLAGLGADPTGQRFSPTGRPSPDVTWKTQVGQPVVNWGSHHSLLRSDRFLDQVTELRESYLRLQIYYRKYNKGWQEVKKN